MQQFGNPSCHYHKQLHMKKLFWILAVIALVTSSLSAISQTSDTNQVKLLTNKYFRCFTFDLPDNLTRTSEAKTESWSHIVVYNNVKDSVHVMIRMKKVPGSLNDIKELHESSTSFYSGKIQRSEVKNINGQDVLVFLMTGYWNGAKAQSTWLKCFVISKNSLFQFLIRFPKNYEKYPADLLEGVINSIKVCK
jgi:hypothetical protein